MVDEAKRCPVCLLELISITWQDESWDKIECAHCGNFAMNGYLVQQMRRREHLTPAHLRYLPVLPAYIRSENHEGRTPRVERDWSTAVREWEQRRLRTKRIP
jgi:hypothetical protein